MLGENDFSFNLNHHSSKHYIQNRIYWIFNKHSFFQNRIFWMQCSKTVTTDIKKYLLLIAQENVKVYYSKQDLLKDLITFLIEENWEIKPYAN